MRVLARLRLSGWPHSEAVHGVVLVAEFDSDGLASAKGTVDGLNSGEDVQAQHVLKSDKSSGIIYLVSGHGLG